jgi:hypothetical protein
MLTSFFNLSRCNPFRPVDWRIRRADELSLKMEPPSRHEDRLVVELKRFLDIRVAAHSPDELRRVRAAMPRLFLAFELHEASEPSLRWLLEARILAREPVDTLATRVGFPADVLQSYMDAFFDVADRLGYPDFVNQQILEPLAKSGSSIECFWKTVAFSRGAAALNELVGDNGNSGGRIRSGLEGYTEKLLQQRIAHAIFRADPEKTAPELLRAYVQLQRMKLGGDEERLTGLETHIQKWVESLEHMYRVGDEPDHTANPVLDKFEKTAAELRDDEMMRIFNGETLANEEEIANMRIPPPGQAHEQG